MLLCCHLPAINSATEMRWNKVNNKHSRHWTSGINTCKLGYLNHCTVTDHRAAGRCVQSHKLDIHQRGLGVGCPGIRSPDTKLLLPSTTVCGQQQHQCKPAFLMSLLFFHFNRKKSQFYRDRKSETNRLATPQSRVWGLYAQYNHKIGRVASKEVIIQFNLDDLVRMSVL